MKTISVLGSTGSIGTQTLEVVSASGGKLSVHSLAANTNVDELEKQIRQYKPKLAVMMEEKAAAELKKRIADLPVKVRSGME
jgi:1-deoxy-D-xylulose-5-phosphate reductoisomerase